MTDIRLGDAVHYTNPVARVGAPCIIQGWPEARCQAAIVIGIDGDRVMLSVYGDHGPSVLPGVERDGGSGWGGFTITTWHPIH